MSVRVAKLEGIDPDWSSRISDVLGRYDSETGPLVVVEDRVRRRGDGISVPIRPLHISASLMSLIEAIAEAEIDLQDSGLDVVLTPDLPQKLIVVAKLENEGGPYIYASAERSELEHLAKLLGRNSEELSEIVELESYPFDGPDQQMRALKAALEEYPMAKILAPSSLT